MTTSTITDLLSAPLDPNWTVDGLADRVLGAVAAQPPDSEQEFVLTVDDTTDRQVRRLIRPLLACLATKSASEAGLPVSLYGGHLSFMRPGPAGPVWVVGDFENQPGSVRVTLRRANRSAVEAKSPFRGGGSLPPFAQLLSSVVGFGHAGMIAGAIGSDLGKPDAAKKCPCCGGLSFENDDHCRACGARR